MTDLTGKVALVTGGTRGIGLATGHALAAAGATVVLTGRDESVAKERAGEVAAASDATVTGVGLDVTDSAAVGAVIRAVAKEHGRLDITVANAGVLENAMVGMMRSDLVDRMLSTNVAGTIHTVQAAARAMMRHRAGAIVLLASIVGERGSAGQTAYAASKAAVANVARSTAKELGRFGIRVNAVAPGLIETQMTADLPAELVDGGVAATPLGRLGRAEEVAAAIRFLVSDEASFITGQVLGVDGGMVL
jgi:3-oxoacyl-[acyl-carrier protein] reductase